MALTGEVVEFQENHNWIEYTGRLNEYFFANEITDNGTKRVVLFSSCGAKTYKLIRNLESPGKPNDKTFTELVNYVKNHLSPQTRDRRSQFTVSSFTIGTEILSKDWLTTIRDSCLICRVYSLLCIGYFRRTPVGIGAERTTGVWRIKVLPEVIETIGTLWRPKATAIRLWCISKRFGRGALPQDGG